MSLLFSVVSLRNILNAEVWDELCSSQSMASNPNCLRAVVSILKDFSTHFLRRSNRLEERREYEAICALFVADILDILYNWLIPWYRALCTRSYYTLCSVGAPLIDICLHLSFSFRLRRTVIIVDYVAILSFCHFLLTYLLSWNIDVQRCPRIFKTSMAKSSHYGMLTSRSSSSVPLAFRISRTPGQTEVEWS